MTKKFYKSQRGLDPPIFSLRILLVSLFNLALLTAAGSALANTDVCVGPATTTTVTTLIKVQPGMQFDEFIDALHTFAEQNKYDWGPSATGERGSGKGKIDIVLIKKGTSEAIHVHSGQYAEEIIGTMSECGDEGFRPYWEEFMKFVRRYAASRPNYPE